MRGLFIGRFQPLHNGHISIMKAALEEMDQLVVVIGSAETSFTEKDPFTAGERMEMVMAVSNERDWNDRIIPVPVRDLNRYSVWVDHVLSYVPKIDIIYSNNSLTRSLFMAKGMEVKGTPLIDRTDLSGVRIRERMISGEQWKMFVPASVVGLIEEMEGVSRLRSIFGKGDGT